jgi:hypothetical protein
LPRKYAPGSSRPRWIAEAQGVLGAVGDDRLVTGVGEDPQQQPADALVVLDDHHGLRAARLARAAGRRRARFHELVVVGGGQVLPLPSSFVVKNGSKIRAWTVATACSRNGADGMRAPGVNAMFVWGPPPS